MRLTLLSLLLALFFFSCKEEEIESITIKKFRVDSIWQKPEISVHDHISAMRNRARLSNGDIISISNEAKVGDTIEYKYIKLKRVK